MQTRFRKEIQVANRATYTADWGHEDIVAAKKGDELLSCGNQFPRNKAHAQDGTKNLASSYSKDFRQQAIHVCSKWDGIRTNIHSKHAEEVCR